MANHITGDIIDDIPHAACITEIEKANFERDRAYRVVANLAALVAAQNEGVVCHGADPDYPTWSLLYVQVNGVQMGFHIHPDNADLVAPLPQRHGSNPWDGHTADERDARITAATRVALTRKANP